MGKEYLSQLLLLASGMNVAVGVATAKFDIVYLIAGTVTGALFYYLRHVLNSNKEGTLKNILTKAAER